MQSLEFHIQLDSNDLVGFNIYHFKKRTLIKVAALSLIISVLIPILSEKNLFNNLLMYVGLVLFFNLIMTFVIIILLNKPRWSFGKNSILTEAGKISFNENQFIIEKQGYKSEWKYNSVRSVESDKKALYVYVDKNIAFILPFRFLLNRQEWLAGFLKSKQNTK